MLFTTIDIETTGFDQYGCDIIQFAYAITSETGETVKAETLYFYYPGVERSWSEEAFAVHGITLEELRKHEEEFETNLHKMWIAMYKSNCVSFNGDRFDIPFVQKWLKRMGYPIVEVYNSYDVMRIFQNHGFKGKLVDMPGKIGLSTEIISMVTEQRFGDKGHAHAAYYDITATNLLFNYAVNKKWVDLNAYDMNKVNENMKDRRLDESAGKTLFNQLKYYIESSDGVVYEVALCPDPEKYIYYKQVSADSTPQFKEREKGVFVAGNICIKDTGHMITLELVD